MCEKREKIKITIIYPRRPGFIMEAHKLQRQLASQFGLSVLLEERLDECFTVVLNGTTIYTNLTEDESYIDHKKIISSVCGYKNPLVKSLEETPQPDDNDDQDHLQWMNSVCSGE